MREAQNTALCAKVNPFHLSITYFGRATVDAGWSGHISVPAFSRLYYIADGALDITADDGAAVRLEGGRWYLLPAGMGFEYRCEKEMDHIFFHLKLCDGDGEDLFNGCARPLCLETDDPTEFIMRCMRSDDIAVGLRLRQTVYGVLLSLIEKYGVAVRESELSPYVRKAMRYIRQNLSVQLTISDVAEALFVSKSTLTKHFKTELSLSVREYIFEAVMEEAMQLVLRNETSILAISEKYGFSDQFYFSKRFKQRFGKSPREYRRSGLV